jgi:hypothetical protein
MNSKEEQDRIATRWVGNMLTASHLSDGELIDAVYDRMDNMDITGPNYNLLSELLDRFQQLAGVIVTPGGITIDGEPRPVPAPGQEASE